MCQAWWGQCYGMVMYGCMWLLTVIVRLILNKHWCSHLSIAGSGSKTVMLNAASVISTLFSLSFIFTPLLAPHLFLTFLAKGDGVVHDPADQSHEKTQQNEKDPVLPHPRDQELLTARCTHWGKKERKKKKERKEESPNWKYFLMV